MNRLSSLIFIPIVLVCTSIPSYSNDIETDRRISSAFERFTPYASLGGSSVLTRDDTSTYRAFTTPPIPAPDPLTVGFEPGWGVVGAIGLDGLPYGFRAEVEVAHRQSSVENTAVSGALGTIGVTGDIQATSLMANLLYDFEVTPTFEVYLGGGFGIAAVDLDFRLGPGTVAPGLVIARGDYTAASYQAIAGASYEISENVSLFAQYNYFVALGTDTSVFNTTFPNSTVSNFDYRAHSVTGGIRIEFDAF